MQTTEERRSELQNNYYFLCECKRCLVNYEKNFVNSLICTNVECKAAIPIKNKLEEVCFTSLHYIIFNLDKYHITLNYYCTTYFILDSLKLKLNIN